MIRLAVMVADRRRMRDSSRLRRTLSRRTRWKGRIVREVRVTGLRNLSPDAVERHLATKAGRAVSSGHAGARSAQAR